MMILRDVQLATFSGEKEDFRAVQMLFSNEDNQDGFTATFKVEGEAREIAKNMRMVAKLIDERA